MNLDLSLTISNNYQSCKLLFWDSCCLSDKYLKYLISQFPEKLNLLFLLKSHDHSIQSELETNLARPYTKYDHEKRNLPEKIQLLTLFCQQKRNINMPLPEKNKKPLIMKILFVYVLSELTEVCPEYSIQLVNSMARAGQGFIIQTL